MGPFITLYKMLGLKEAKSTPRNKLSLMSQMTHGTSWHLMSALTWYKILHSLSRIMILVKKSVLSLMLKENFKNYFKEFYWVILFLATKIKF